METREVMVANTKTQKRYKITTDATTLGELKASLDANGIDYRDMTFTEGISKTTLNGDESQLPTNVMYKGQPTNNLVILLTNTKKNIASGISGDRQDAYEFIRENNLQEDILERFGRNFTQVRTSDLWDFIETFDEDDELANENCCNTPTPAPVKAEDIVAALYEYIKKSVEIKTMTPQQVADLAELLDEYSARLKECNISMNAGGSVIGHDEIDEMIAELG